jgi:hypothetical protein
MIATTDQSRKRKLQLLPRERARGKGWSLRYVDENDRAAEWMKERTLEKYTHLAVNGGRSAVLS